jgi:carboxyl-terminal processing protease
MLLLALRRRHAARTAFRAVLLIVLFASAPAMAQTGAPPPPGLDTAPIAHVLAAALGFMAPRILDPVPIPQLTVWGLHGITSLDQNLTAELRDGSLRLVAPPDRILFAQAPPPIADANAWGGAASQMMQAAWSASAAVRSAGAPGLVQSFFDELFNHLDPYSRYVAPLQAVSDRENRSGDAGIGATIALRGNAFIVQSVLAGGPASDAHIRPGEQILSIDGESVAGLGLGDVNSRIAGPDGSDMTLVLRSYVGRRARTRTVAVTRASVPPETVFSSRTGNLLVIRITGFAADTGSRIVNELSLGMSRRPAGIIFDLRGNRGGLLRQSVEGAGAVLADAIISETVGRDPEANHLFRAEGPDIANGIPIVLLVDGRTASAAEIMSAALIDQRRAVAVGSSTLGKGLVQTIDPLPDGGELFVTWSRVLAPLGWPLQGLGVLPQICTSLGQEQLAQQLADLAEGRLDMAQALARHNAARAPLPAAAIVELRNACPAAEGRDADLDAARFLLTHPTAYAAALLPAAAGPRAP